MTRESGYLRSTDMDLVEKARGGDSSAFHKLVDRYAGSLFGLAVSLSGNAADAEDMLQETFTGAFRGLGAFEGRSSVKTWLTRILIRQRARHWRSTHRGKAATLSIEEAPDSKEDVRKNIEAVRASAQRLSQMVTDILEKEKVLEGRSEPALAVIAVEDILHKVHEVHKAEAEQKGLYFMEPGVPYGMPKVLANEDHLYRVVDNLVTNAMKYTPKNGSVWCEIEIKGGEVWVMVNDTGLGMEPDEVPHLFKRFERGRSSEVREKQGAGLGLFIAKELVEVMGGRIWAASRGKDHGTTIVFTLKAIFEEVTA